MSDPRRPTGAPRLATDSHSTDALRDLDDAALHEIAAGTLTHYEEKAESFWLGTKDHDVSQNVEALLRHLDGPGPHTILDLGCGPGRDLVTFKERGHEPVGLDGAPAFVRMAQELSGCEVLHQDFLSMQLPPGRFDGVFANAVLFHVPSQELPRVLAELAATLAPGGVLFSSNPRGANQEGWSGGRYGCWLDLETWRAYLATAGFVELEHYYRPTGRPRQQQPWLASVWRKSA
jgi:SAM-dependent methyltransferase